MKNKFFSFNTFLIVMFLLAGSACKRAVESRYVFKRVQDLPKTSGLQDPFMKPDGSRVNNPEEWKEQRTYLKDMLANYMYGKMPPKPESFEIEPLTNGSVFSDSLVEQTFNIVLERSGKIAKFKVGIRRPNKAGRFPVVIKNDSFIFDIEEVADEGKRKKYIRLGRDRIEDFVAREAFKRNYVICKFDRNQVSPDNANYRNEGVMPLYSEYEWGTIASWAWAYQVIIDHLEKLDFIDVQKIVVTGHSRGGKTALCAGVYEDRIAITAPNSSGGGGTASWRYFDEEHERQLVQYHRERFPHWWHPAIFDFSGQEDKMPFDAHFQKALIAPRGLINPHSRDDYWANPYGTYLTYLGAEFVYKWLGAEGHQGVHWRNGPHNQNEEDWIALFEFCDRYFHDKTSQLDFTQNPHPDKYTYNGLINFKLPE